MVCCGRWTFHEQPVSEYSLNRKRRRRDGYVIEIDLPNRVGRRSIPADNCEHLAIAREAGAVWSLAHGGSSAAGCDGGVSYFSRSARGGDLHPLQMAT